MDDQIKKILFTDLPGTHYGKALEIYLQEELGKLNDVSTVQSWDETLGRREASKIMKRIFGFLNAEKGTGEKTDYR